MSYPVGIHDVAPRSQISQPKPDLGTSQARHAYRAYAPSSAPLRYGPYQKRRRDLSFVRIIAASALITGLLLGVGPTVLTPLGRLLAGVPALFTQGIPIPGASGTDASDVTTDTAPADAGALRP